MNYEFPTISNIEVCLEAIKDKPEFIVKRDHTSGVAIVNYVFASNDTFPDPKSFTDSHEQFLATVRRECRGITFDLESGDIVKRKFHKFFNVNQLPEVSSHVIDWTQPHHVLEKLDGSLCSSFRRKDGVREFHTKMGATDVAEKINDFVSRSNINYNLFEDILDHVGYSAIYEYCSRAQRIVIDYPVEKMVLTAIRDTVRGLYLPYPAMKRSAEAWGIPVVKALDSQVDDVQLFLKNAADLMDEEGYVVRFENGHMVKVKANHYCLIHRTHDLLHLEKDVWSLILNDAADDAKPLMQDHMRKAVEGFEQALFDGITDYANKVSEIVENARIEVGNDKKRFALEIAPKSLALDRQLLFVVWDGKNAVDAVKSKLQKNIGTQTKIDEIRYLVNNARWDDFYNSSPTDGD